LAQQRTSTGLLQPGPQYARERIRRLLITHPRDPKDNPK